MIAARRPKQPYPQLRRRPWYLVQVAMLLMLLISACAPAAPAAPTAAPAKPTEAAKPAAPAAASSPAAAASSPAAAAPASSPAAAAASPAAAASKPVAAAAPSTAVRSTGPRPGGVVTIVSGQNIQSINVLYTAAGLALSAAKMVQRGLLFYDEKDEFTGELAEAVPTLQNGGISQDGKTITYKLRQNVKWHDGKPVTSADVKFTWQAIMNPNSKVVSRYGYDLIDAVDTPDDYTVILRFKQPFAPWAILFDAIIPKHLLENEADLSQAAFNRKPIGFGPLKVNEWVSGDHITWDANPDYFRGGPRVDKVIMRFVPSTEAALNAVRAGEVEIGWGLNEPAIPQLRALEPQGIRTIVDVIPNSHRYAFNMNKEKAPIFADIKVRKAIALAINKQDLVEKLLYGVTKPGRTEWDNTYWENTSLQPYPFAPDEAKKLLDEAGWAPGPDGIRVKDGKRLTFAHSTYTGDQLLENVQLFVQRNLKDVGIEMTIKNVALATAFASYQAGGTWATAQYEMGGWLHGLRNPDPDLSFRFACSQIPSDTNPTGSQWYHYCNQEVDKLFAQQANIFDPAERKKVIDQIQKLIYDDYAVVYLYNYTSIYAVKKTLKNFEPHAWGNFYWNVQDWEIGQ